MDLLEAEAVHDLVAAETEAQRRQAVRQMDGALGAIYRDWADRLRGALAYQEALIDCPDEDLPSDVEARLLATLGDIRREIAAHLDDRRRGEKLRDGLFFAAGPACSEATDSAASSERMFSAAWAPIASETMPTRTAATASGRREMRNSLKFISSSCPSSSAREVSRANAV